MAEYEQLGAWMFWDTYGNVIRYIDGNLIGPSLRVFGVVVAQEDKWPLNTNSYSFLLDYRECEFVFDASYPGAQFEVMLRRYDNGRMQDIGKLVLESGIPTSPVQHDSFKKSLGKLLEIARR